MELFGMTKLEEVGEPDGEVAWDNEKYASPPCRVHCLPPEPSPPIPPPFTSTQAVLIESPSTRASLPAHAQSLSV
jgi:hypothetical protein